MLLAVKNMGGESEAAWRALLDDLVKRGLLSMARRASIEKALAALWSDMPVRAARCISTVIFSPMRPTGCTRKSPLITTI